MSRKKKSIVQLPVALCGILFPKDYLEELKEQILEEFNDEVDLIGFLQEFIGNFDFSQLPHFKNFLVIPTDSVVKYGESTPDGYYVGVNFFDLPEHFSQKRAKIDVRKVFEDIGLIDSEEDVEAVQIFNLVLNYENS